MKVSQVSTWKVQCGIAEYTELLCRGLEHHGVAWEVVPIDREHAGYLAKRELSAYFERLGEELHDADVVHIQHEFAFFSGGYHFRASMSNFRRLLKAACRHGRPVLVTFHTSPFYVDWSKIDWTGQDPIKQALLQGAKAWWRAEVVSFINRHPQICSHVHGKMGRRLLIDSGIKSERIALIPHGTPSPRPAPSGPSRAATRERLGLAEDATVIGIFGFLAASKGHADALTALEHLPEDFQLLLIGGPHPGDAHSALGEVMERIRQKPQLGDRVAVTGFLPEAEALRCLDAVDVMVAPYRDHAQTVSGALGWALSSGRPVIASRIPAFQELAHEAGCAELIAPNSPGELALAIERLAGDPDLRDRLVSNSLAWCEANSWDAVAERHAELYSRLLAGLPRVRTPARSSLDRAPLSAGPSGPLRVAGAGAQTLALRRSEVRPRAAGAGALIRSAVLPDGRKLAFAVDPDALDDPLARLVLERGYPGDLPCELALHLLSRGQTFVDVGARLGTFTLAAAAMGCRVLALEALMANVRLLRTAVTYNGFESITVLHGVPGEVPGVVRPRENGSRSRITAPNGRHGGPGSAEEINAYRIDDLLQEHGIGAVDLIKLTLGGRELEAVGGLEQTLSQLPAPAVMFEANATALGERSQTLAELKRAFVELGYSLFLIDRRDPGRLIPVTAEDLQGEAIAEYLACKGDALATVAPWRIGRPFDDRQLVERLRAETEAQDGARRRYAASVLRVAPPKVTEDPLMRAALADLRRARDPRLGRILDGEEPVAHYGLTEERDFKQAVR
jgi:FkbM family methyltransferase